MLALPVEPVRGTALLILLVMMGGAASMRRMTDAMSGMVWPIPWLRSF